MDFILTFIKKVIIFSFNNGIWAIIKVSLVVSFCATSIAVIIGVPLGAFIALKKFPFKNIFIVINNTCMGLPPVLVGLVVSLFLFRNGCLGALGWIYTIQGIILAQIIIALPIIMGLTLAAFQSTEKRLYFQILDLGANKIQALYLLFKEVRVSILAAIIAGFGSVISEVGAVMMVGGNIKNQTRVLTTAIVLETQMGNFDIAITLGLILLAISFIINLALTFIQQEKSH